MKRDGLQYQKGESGSPKTDSGRGRSDRKERGPGLFHRIYAFIRTFLAFSFIIGIVGLILVALLNHFSGDAFSGRVGGRENE